MKQDNWEKDFDSVFDLDGHGNSHIVQGKVKQFIRGLLSKKLFFYQCDELIENAIKYGSHKCKGCNKQISHSPYCENCNHLWEK